jgi:hypothetical protein
LGWPLEKQNPVVAFRGDSRARQKICPRHEWVSERKTMENAGGEHMFVLRG